MGPTNRIKWHLGLVYFGFLLWCNMDNMYRTTHLLQKKRPYSYSSSCDIEMFVVMQRRQSKMAINGLSSPFSFDRHSTKQKKFAIRYYLFKYIYKYYACDLTTIRNMSDPS